MNVININYTRLSILILALILVSCGTTETVTEDDADAPFLMWMKTLPKPI
jgi:hypothetical protein